MDLLHEFELGVLKSILKHLLRIIYASAPARIDVLNHRYAVSIHFKEGTQDYDPDRFTLVPPFGKTVRRFPDNVADTSQRPAWHFEDVLQIRRVQRPTSNAWNKLR